MNEHQILLRELGQTLPKGSFISRELDLSQLEDSRCVAAQFGGPNQMKIRYPGLHTLYRRSLAQRNALNATNVGFQDKAKILALGYDAATGTAYAMGTMTLTAPAQRLYLTLDVYAGDTLVAHNARFFSACVAGEIEIQSPEMPPLKDGEEYTAYLHATWEPGKNGLLRSQVASDQASAGAKDLVKNLTVTHPRHIRSPESGAITVAYARSAPELDYTYPETRDKISKNEIVMLDMEGQVDLEEGYHVSAVENAGSALSCQGFGDILYLGSITYDEDKTKPGVVFFPLNNGTSIGWKLERNWNNEIPDSVRFGNRTHDLEFSFSFRCQEDQTLHDVLLTSKGTELVLSQPHVKKVSKIHLYWGCLAAGTKVTMLDGSQKNIEELQQGNQLLSPKGGAVTVKHLIPGTEENIYRVHLSNGMEVRATRLHPLGTQDGFIAPIDLTSQSQLMTRQGLANVLYCYPETYQGTVYGVELEDGDSFFADGVVSGANKVMGILADRWNDDDLVMVPDQDAAEERDRLEADFRAGLI